MLRLYNPKSNEAPEETLEKILIQVYRMGFVNTFTTYVPTGPLYSTEVNWVERCQPSVIEAAKKEILECLKKSKM